MATAIKERDATLDGIVYRFQRDELALLDRCEGHPWLYRRRTVVVRYRNNRRCIAQVYLLHLDADEGTPPPRYFGILKRAYRKLGLSQRALTSAHGGMR